MNKIYLIAVIFLVGVAALVFSTQSAKPYTPTNGQPKASAGGAAAKNGLELPLETSKSDGASSLKQETVQSDAAKVSAKQEVVAAKKTDNPNDYGITQPVRTDLNPQVASVSEALRGKKHPERLSPLIQPKPFDPEAYKKNPTEYLNVVEPGRCFQSKNPAKDIPKIQSLSPQFQEVAQGKSVTLRVQALAKWPVSYSSMDMGKFQNELTSITVEANESGIAEAQFFGTPGTIDEVKILVSSPMTSGQIQFLINVTK